MSAEEDLGGPASDSALQFDRVELASPASGRACARCQRAIADEFFELAGRIICPSCRRDLSPPGSTPAFLRGLLFGGSAALLGTILWFAVVKLTGHEFGLIAIAIGFLVGAAVRRGSGGRSGWKYQTLAMVLTYVSITASYVPLVVKELAAGGAKRAGEVGETSRDGASPAGDARAAAAPAPAKPSPAVGQLLLAFAVVFGIAFAAPFLGGTSNIMGIIIIGIALYEAWKINRRVPLAGPFRIGLGAPAPPAAAAAGGGMSPPPPSSSAG